VVAAVTMPQNGSQFIYIGKTKNEFPQTQNNFTGTNLASDTVKSTWQHWSDVSSFRGSKGLGTPGHRCQDAEIKTAWTRVYGGLDSESQGYV